MRNYRHGRRMNEARRRIKQVDIGYWQDSEDIRDCMPGRSLRGYINYCNKVAMYDNERVNLDDVVAAAFTEDGIVVQLIDGTYFEFSERYDSTRGWIVDDEEEIEYYNDAFN